MKQRLVIWGASGHALTVAEIVRREGKYDIIGFLDDINSHRRTEVFCGSTILGGREQLRELWDQGIHHILFGFGDCRARLQLADWVRSQGFVLATAIHPQAVVATDVRIGEGTVIAAGAVINPATSIGENVIINTCASVDHECHVEDGCHIAPGVHLGGRVKVGKGVWIGIGATVTDRISIGAGSLIGVGAVVLHEIPENVVAYGIPARVIRSNKRDDG
ncbi:MAG TPA: sugar acetyltransferase [Nitrospiraceae bacterium]|jgi:acetyltransferase EpsM|nr:sugar acetyltransferase [Nitrospiraceae bacterium]